MVSLKDNVALAHSIERVSFELIEQLIVTCAKLNAMLESYNHLAYSKEVLNFT